jgi:hypothetical protein
MKVRYLGNNLDVAVPATDLIREGKVKHIGLSEANAEKDATPAQWALAWLLAQRLWIVRIPSSRKLHRLDENTASAALVVTAGCGLDRGVGGPIQKIRPGDVVWFPPGEKHCHGAAPTTAMTHIAIVEILDSQSAGWLEQVSDDYAAP